MASYTSYGNYVSFDGSISLHENSAFHLAVPTDVSADAVGYYAYVIDCVTGLFQQVLPSLKERGVLIRNDPDAPNPRYERRERRIILHTHPVRWAQVTYQYAHELCHHAIRQDVPDSLRFLEESLCATASFYFLRKLAYLWQARGDALYNADTGRPFAPELVSYAVEEGMNARVFNPKDPEMQRYLAGNCYDRAKNDYLAAQFLPIFTEYPATWLAVPQLCKVRSSTLPAALEEWMRLSPAAAQTGLGWIRNLF